MPAFLPQIMVFRSLQELRYPQLFSHSPPLVHYLRAPMAFQSPMHSTASPTSRYRGSRFFESLEFPYYLTFTDRSFSPCLSFSIIGPNIAFLLYTNKFLPAFPPQKCFFHPHKKFMLIYPHRRSVPTSLKELPAFQTNFAKADLR